MVHLTVGNVRSTITTLTGIVTTTVAAGSTSGISTTPNYGYFVVDYETNVRGNVGIATTMVTGGRKCARDLGYIIDAVTMDITLVVTNIFNVQPSSTSMVQVILRLMDWLQKKIFLVMRLQVLLHMPRRQLQTS